MHPQTFCLTQQATRCSSLPLSLPHYGLSRSRTLTLSLSPSLCLCLTLSYARSLSLSLSLSLFLLVGAAISGLNFKRSSNFHTIFRLRSFALSTGAARSRPSQPESTPTTAHPLPPVAPFSRGPTTDSRFLVGTCSVTHSSYDFGCAFHFCAHIFSDSPPTRLRPAPAHAGSCHLCHKNISNTCQATVMG